MGPIYTTCSDGSLMLHPVTDLGYESVRISASLLAGAVAHEKDGRPALAESIRRTVEAYSVSEQTKLTTEASIRRAVREVSRW